MLVRIILLLVLCGSLTACAGGTAAGLGVRSDVFQVMQKAGEPGTGLVPVSISASIKTHTESSIPFELAQHGSDAYRLVIDIDGQSLDLPFETMAETTTSDPLRDPESGSGLRYSYRATVALRPGSYRVSAWLPTENVTVSQEVQISADTRQIIIKPLYRGLAGRKPASLRWQPTFKDGVSALNMVVN